MKRRFDDNPVLWQLMLFISEGAHGSASGLVVCVSVVRTLLTVLIQHWQRCRAHKSTAFRRELESSVTLMECLAKVRLSKYVHLHAHLNYDNVHNYCVNYLTQ